jgi:hypothetical protein
MTVEYPLISDTGKRYRMLDEDRREYESGTIWNEKTKSLERGIFTEENAGTMQERSVISRHTNAIAAARKGLVMGVSATELVDDPYISWAHIVAAQAELAMTPDMGHASVRAAEFCGKASDLMPGKAPTVQGDVNVLTIMAQTQAAAEEILEGVATEVGRPSCKVCGEVHSDFIRCCTIDGSCRHGTVVGGGDSGRDDERE